MNIVPDHPSLWRPGQYPQRTADGLPSGHATLDQLLAGGGWPRAGLTELLLAQPGSGELALLLPLLRNLGGQSRWLVLVNPPLLPYAPALARAGIDLDRLLLVRPTQAKALVWSCEQSLRSAGCAALLCWPGHQPLRYPELRKLQLAAAEGGHPAFLFRSAREAGQSSPSPLRLLLEPTAEGLALELLKQRGGHTGQRLLLQPELPLQPLPPYGEWPLPRMPAAAAAGSARQPRPPATIHPLSRQQRLP